MTRYQDSKQIVKLWRLRHYVYIPFEFIIQKLRGGDDFPNNKTLWRLLVSVAQVRMNWTYTDTEITRHAAREVEDFNNDRSDNSSHGDVDEY